MLAAALAFAVVDAEFRVAIELARHPRDRVLQHLFDRRGVPVCRLARRAGWRGDRRGPPVRRQVGDVQRLAHVDVAEAGDHALIHERDFEGNLLAPAGGRQRGAVELRRQRLGSELAQRRVCRELAGRHQIHHPEAPRVVEEHRCAG
jgi:hypothetical protein